MYNIIQTSQSQAQPFLCVMEFNLLKWSKVGKGDYDARRPHKMPVLSLDIEEDLHLQPPSGVLAHLVHAVSVAHCSHPSPHSLLISAARPPFLLPFCPVSGSDWPISACSERNLALSVSDSITPQSGAPAADVGQPRKLFSTSVGGLQSGWRG